ncbi:MAG: Na/Pi cotransporter family protein [Eubacteriales bacterium]|nr:Na/Pi cotransporter family protein [Eubacteriales bacterium]
MSIFNFLTLFGGLALFLYGMELMGEGLEQASGGKLEKILENLTSNLFRAVLLGIGVTAVIQSSSATTVMVVGFVNSGIMPLSRAVGIIMGANVGTTVTAWILSLAGIESSNFFVQLLNPSSFSPILGVIGIGLIMFSKRDKSKDIGHILVGFTILMYGMDIMSGAVEPLADVPAFTNILLMFSNPVLGVMAGAVLTAIIQSSSASVGILQALCMSGTVPYSTALPIIMGQNIGTCVTAILSSIGANRNARRAAGIHLMFNLIGTVLFLTVFYTANLFVDFAFLSENATPVGIAMIHTIFNVTVTLVLLPFSQKLVKLAYLVIRVTDEERAATPRTLDILDERFLEVPGYALEQGEAATMAMFKEVRKSLAMSDSLIEDYSPDTVVKIKESEDLVDGYENQISNYLLTLSRKNLNEAESQLLSVLLYSIGDIETISDQVCNIAIAYRGMESKESSFSAKAVQELKVQQEAVKALVDATIAMFDDHTIKDVYACRQVVFEVVRASKERHMVRLMNHECAVELGMVLTDILNSYERIAIRCMRIASYLSQIDGRELEIHDHEHLLAISDYQELYKKYKEKYALPKQ